MAFYFARMALYLPGEERTTVMMGERVEATQFFTDADGVRCADVIARGRRLSIPMDLLQPKPLPPSPPSQALEVGALRRTY